MSASEALSGIGDRLDRFDPIDLTALVAAADLQQRHDTKYVVPLARLDDVLDSLGAQVQVLEVDGRRETEYRTTYFDTPELATYRAHIQRRRRRYKIRTRTYGRESAMLEVKTKDKAGRTVKHRRAHPGPQPDVLSSAALAYVEERLYEAYGFAVPTTLERSAVTTYTRTTLADIAAGERATIDANLKVASDGQTVAFHPDAVLVETKTATRFGRFDRALRAAGIRPVRVSKYGVGVAVLHPNLPSNQWRRALRMLAPVA